MKISTLFLALSLLLFSGCEEIMPVIPDFQASGNRKVLIEEFTGVRCVNCPAGSAVIESLLGQLPNNLIAISIHAGFFSPPYSSSKYDFRTTEGTALTGYFGGEAFGYPAAIINREIFPGESTYYLDRSTWASRIQSEIQKEAEVLVDIDNNYNPATRQLDVSAKITPLTNLPDDLHLTVLITESNIKDYQLLPAPDGWVSDYSHKHVFRTTLTNFDGNAISEALTTGVTVSRTFSKALPADWKAENCHVIAFVHRSDANSKYVLNAEEAEVVE